MKLTANNCAKSLIIALLVILLTPQFSQSEEPSKKVRILTAFFPIYLFAQNIVAGMDAFEVDLLLPSDYGCPHDYALSPDDLKKIHEADVIILNGLGMEGFLSESILAGNPDAKIIIASHGLPPLPLKYAHKHENGQNENEIYNPHLFASPKMASLMAGIIADSLKSFYPDYAEQMARNGANYKARLDSVDVSFRDSLKELANNRIVTVHEAFDYMARDYGFEIAEVIEKEPGYEPSAGELVNLAKKIKASKVAGLYSEPQYSARIVEVIGRETGIPVFSMDPVATGPADPPLDYYEKVMMENLKHALKGMK
jgi:ABC-type Zn uptake system ZnuABC Zn-binding protein ZnuA